MDLLPTHQTTHEWYKLLTGILSFLIFSVSCVVAQGSNECLLTECCNNQWIININYSLSGFSFFFSGFIFRRISSPLGIALIIVMDCMSHIYIKATVQLGHFTWCDWADHHRFLTACHKAKAKDWVSSHLHLPGRWWHKFVSVQANLLQGAALGDVTVRMINMNMKCFCHHVRLFLWYSCTAFVLPQMSVLNVTVL